MRVLSGSGKMDREGCRHGLGLGLGLGRRRLRPHRLDLARRLRWSRGAMVAAPGASLVVALPHGLAGEGRDTQPFGRHASCSYSCSELPKFATAKRLEKVGVE